MGEDDKSKLLWVIASVLTGSVALNQGINKKVPGVRSDPFTGSQGKRLEARMQLEHDNCRKNIEAYVDRELEHATILLLNKMPPHGTRIRIHALERHVEQEDPTYSIPTQAW